MQNIQNNMQNMQNTMHRPVCWWSPRHAGTVTCVTLQGVVRHAARPASQSRHPRAGSDGRINPLRHRRLDTESPSRTASHTRTAGPKDQSCPSPVAEPWQSDISERSCASSTTVRGGLLLCAGHGATVDDDWPDNGWSAFEVWIAVSSARGVLKRADGETRQLRIQPKPCVWLLSSVGSRDSYVTRRQQPFDPVWRLRVKTLISSAQSLNRL
jgi:hypothetical protein